MLSQFPIPILGTAITTWWQHHIPPIVTFASPKTEPTLAMDKGDSLFLSLFHSYTPLHHGQGLQIRFVESPTPIQIKFIEPCKAQRLRRRLFLSPSSFLSCEMRLCAKTTRWFRSDLRRLATVQIWFTEAWKARSLRRPLQWFESGSGFPMVVHTWFLVPHGGSDLILDLNMQSIRKSILARVNLRRSTERWFLAGDESVHMQLRCWCSSTAASSDRILDRVIALTKKYDKIDASKVTETADFQKDLNLDSLDWVELIMALEEEFSIEIPDEKADKLTCCADVAKYIASETDQKNLQKP